MLDLSSVKTQIDQMVGEQVQRPQRMLLGIENALEQVDRWSGDWHTLAEKIERSSTSWLLPGITEGPDARYARPSRPERISIAATDGSQIFPDRHEISPCYLINIGYILLHYGSGERPIMSSKPSLFYKDEDLFRSCGGRRQAINRELVGFRRSLMELTELSELASAAHEEGYPTVALADGTLIMWSLEAQPPEFHIGDTVDVHTRIIEGEKERVQVFNGVVIAGSGRGINRTFTVRRIVAAVEPYAFDRIYGGWWDREIESGAKEAVRRSAERYIAHLQDTGGR